eukprot:XP_016663260.1 PREDICTED: uncharacterized protein LOC107884837 [Acyrthosiphon pisum]
MSVLLENLPSPFMANTSVILVQLLDCMQNDILIDITLLITTLFELNHLQEILVSYQQDREIIGEIEESLMERRTNRKNYRPNLVHNLVPGDAQRRLTFIAWFMTQLQDQPQLLRYICWTDESKFTNNGLINKQNNRYWADKNPYWTTDRNNQTV